MKAALRAIRNHAYSYADVEVKVREATSNDPWSAPPSLLRELSRATHDYQDYPKLFAMLWKRLSDVEHVLHVSKALQLLHHLLLHGSERFVLDVKRRARDVSALTKYRHFDANNVDDAKEARGKAKLVYELLSNEQRLVAERLTAEKALHAAPNPDEEEEEELYRQRTKQQRQQRQREEEEGDGEGGGGAAASTAPSKVAGVGSRSARRPPVPERDGLEDDEVEVGEEKRSNTQKQGARPKGAKGKGAAAGGGGGGLGEAEVGGRRGQGGDGGGQRKKAAAGEDDFTAVSEEEMDEGEGEEKEGGGEASRRVRTARKVVRKRTTESVAEGDAAEGREDGEGEEAPRMRVQRRDETEEETLSTTRRAAGGGSKQGSAASVTTTSVRGSRSTLQPDGSTATSLYANIAGGNQHSPIPLIDDLLTNPTSAAAAAGSRRGGGGSRAGGSRRVLDDDVDPVSGELDLLSLASRPNVVYVHSAAHSAGELDMLTGPQPIDRTAAPPTSAGRGVKAKAPASAAVSSSNSQSARRAAVAPAVSRAAPAPSSLSAKKRELLAQLAALEGEEGDEEAGDDGTAVVQVDGADGVDAVDPAQAPSTRPPSRSPAAGRAVQRPSQRPPAAPAPRGGSGRSTMRAQHPVVEVVSLDVHDDGPYDEALEVEEEEEPALLDRLPLSSSTISALAPSSSYSSSLRSASATVGRAGARGSARGLTAVAAAAPRSSAADPWQAAGGTLMDLDHLSSDPLHATPTASSSSISSSFSSSSSSSRTKGRRAAAAAEPALSMAEMQSQQTFPSLSSLAISDDSLTSTFARSSTGSSSGRSGLSASARPQQPLVARGGAGGAVVAAGRPPPFRAASTFPLSMSDYIGAAPQQPAAAASAQRRAPPASTDIFFT